jgi:aryl-alcohol dehydrogenase-like predicted oxidoreductase
MKKRGNRDEIVLATKYTTNFQCGPNARKVMANFAGNGTKSLHVSVEASLKKLQTDYIDIVSTNPFPTRKKASPERATDIPIQLYVHWWDYSTSIPELMQSLNALVVSGKVLFLGISDTPAWVVSKANQYARDHGLRQFCVYQGQWSAAGRDFERDIIPMARDEGMALAPWGSLGGGMFKTEEQRKAQEGRDVQPSEKHVKVSKALEAVAKRKGTIITSVALAYVMHKTPYVFPIVGGRTVDHLKKNIEALTLSLSDEDIAEIEDAVPFDIGFPNTFAYGQKMDKHPSEVWLLAMAGTFDYVPLPKPITSSKGGE